MKYFEYISIASSLAGALLNKWNIPGGDIFLIIGLGALVFLYGLAGSVFNKVQEQRGSIMPLTVFSSLSLAVGVLSLIFSHMAWDGSFVIALISFIAIPIALIYNLYKLTQKTENPLHKMIVIRAIIILIALIVF
jgi:hypothetical protein